MKKTIIISIAAISLLSFSAPESKKAAAVADQLSGLYIFLESKPASEYETLGTVKKTGFTMGGGKPKEMLRIMTRRAKDDYPTAEGIIFDDIEMQHATVIKFK